MQNEDGLSIIFYDVPNLYITINVIESIVLVNFNIQYRLNYFSPKTLHLKIVFVYLKI